MLKSFLIFVAMVTMLTNFLYSQTFRAENVLPEKTLLLLEITDGKKFCEDMRSIGLWQLFQESQWKEFFKTIPSSKEMEMLKWQIKSAEKEAGITLEDLHQAFAGQLCLALVDVKMVPGMPFPLPVLLLSWDLGEKKELFEKFFSETRGKLYHMAPMPIEETPFDINGHSVVKISTPMPVFLTYVGNTLVLCNDEDYIKGILNKQEESFASLAKSSQYIAMKKQLLQEHEGAYVYLNLKDSVQTGMNFLGEKAEQVKQVLELSGLDKLYALAMGLSFREGQIVESIYIYTPEGRKGILGSILPDMQASKDLLKYLPKNVLGFNHGMFDIPGLYKTLLDTVKVFQPAAYDHIMEQKKGLEEKLGIQIEDLIFSLGKEYLFSVNFSGGFLPDIAIQWSLSDSKKFQNALENLLKLIPPQYKYNINWNGYNFIYFNFSSKNQPLPVAPTVSVQDNRVIFTPFPENLKNLLTQEKGVLPEDLLKSLKNRNYTVVEYWRFKDIVVPVYRTIVPLLQGMLPRQEIPVEPALLPSADLLEKYLTNTVFFAIHDKEGLLWEMYSPTGTLPFVVLSTVVTHQIQKEILKRHVPEYEKPYVEEPGEENSSQEESSEPEESDKHTEEE